jgi:hypothetical protein
VQYQIGSGAFELATTILSNWSFTPNLTEGAQTITLRAEDVAGNQTSISVQITHQPTVVFVRQGANGKGNGSSWEDAYPDLGPLLLGGTSFPGKTQIWVSAGTYVPAVFDGFIFKSNMTINGGFSVKGTDRDLAGRDLSQNISVLKNHPDGGDVIKNTWLTASNIEQTEINIGLTDFKFIAGGIMRGTLISLSDCKAATLKKILCKFMDLTSVLNISGVDTKVDILDSEFSENNMNGEGISVGAGANVRIRNTKIIHNRALYGLGGITIRSGNVCAGSSSIISDTRTYNDDVFPEVNIYVGGNFSREASVTIGAGGISDGSNTIVTTCPAPF